MQKDLAITERVLADLANHLAVSPSDAYAASLVANIRQWRSELYTCHLLTLPRDVLCLIMKQLTPMEVNRIRSVCKGFKAIADCDALWRHHCEQYIDTDTVERTQPTWRAEYRNNNAMWKAAEENMATYLLQMEMAIAWRSVNEAIFRSRRQSWVDEVREVQKQPNPKKFGELFIELVALVLPQFFTPAWKENQEEWRSRIPLVKRMAEFGGLLLAVDECIDVTAYTYQPSLNLRSQYPHLRSMLPLRKARTVAHPASSPTPSVRPAEGAVSAAG